MKKVVGAKRVENKGSGDERERECVCLCLWAGRSNRADPCGLC